MQSTTVFSSSRQPALRPLPRLLPAALLALAAGASLPARAADAAPADVTMPAVTVLGQSTASTEGTGAYTAGEARSATRMDLSLRGTY